MYTAPCIPLQSLAATRFFEKKTYLYTNTDTGGIPPETMCNKASGVALYNAWGVTRFLAVFQQYKICAPGKNQSGERVRNLLRTRESLAGCRDAVLTRCLSQPIHYGATKHTLPLISPLSNY